MTTTDPRKQATLAVFGEAARYAAQCVSKGRPHQCEPCPQPALGQDVVIHAAGQWRRAIVSKLTPTKVEVVWSAPSTGSLHIKSVPRDGVYRPIP